MLAGSRQNKKAGFSPPGGQTIAATTDSTVARMEASSHVPADPVRGGEFADLGAEELSYLVALARICHSNESSQGDGYLSGLLFENISAVDKLTLKDFVLSNLD